MHDKINKLLCETIQFTHTNGNNIKIDAAVATDAVVKAFIDAGWVKVPDVYIRTDYNTITVNGKEVMTGQEWYNRFMKNLGTKKGHMITTMEWIEAAKKAAGIEPTLNNQEKT